jgi:hypothetical protein
MNAAHMVLAERPKLKGKPSAFHRSSSLLVSDLGPTFSSLLFVAATCTKYHYRIFKGVMQL